MSDDTFIFAAGSLAAAAAGVLNAHRHGDEDSVALVPADRLTDLATALKDLREVVVRTEVERRLAPVDLGGQEDGT